MLEERVKSSFFLLKTLQDDHLLLIKKQFDIDEIWKNEENWQEDVTKKRSLNLILYTNKKIYINKFIFMLIISLERMCNKRTEKFKFKSRL